MPTAGQRLHNLLQQGSHPSPDGDAKKSELNFGHDFDGGFLFKGTITARIFLPNGQETATPVNARTTELEALLQRFRKGFLCFWCGQI